MKDREEEKESLEKHYRIEMESLQTDLKRERESNSQVAMEDYSKLEQEHSDLRRREQIQSRQLKNLEAERIQQVEESLKLRQSLDRLRQDLSQFDSEKRTMTQRIDQREVEYNLAQDKLGELEHKLTEEVKDKSKKA